MKRPLSIVWFERFYVLGIVLPTINLIATWKETMNPDGDDGAAIVSIALIFIGLTYVASFCSGISSCDVVRRSRGGW